LAEIKQEKKLRQIPVFVLSTSTGCDDISRAYDLHANCYLPKPVDLEALVRMSQCLEAFWLNTAVLAGNVLGVEILHDIPGPVRAHG